MYTYLSSCNNQAISFEVKEDLKICPPNPSNDFLLGLLNKLKQHQPVKENTNG